MKTLQFQNETVPSYSDGFPTTNETFITFLGWTEVELDIFSAFLERLQQPDFEVKQSDNHYKF